MIRAYVAGTFDTKHAELSYLCQCLHRAGVDVCTVDLSTTAVRVSDEGRTAANPVCDVTAVEVAKHHPDGQQAIFNQANRGTAIAAMAHAFEIFLPTRIDLAGIIGAGGSGGTALLAPAFRSLPIGTPKVLVSTVASGNVAQYVGAVDMTLMYSVTDVQGLNSISKHVLGNAAHALAGMVKFSNTLDIQSDKPTIGLSMFGVTTTCIKMVTAALHNTYDCLVFHATGTGGQSMEKLVDSNRINGLIDLTTTEIADMLVGGIFASNEDRLGAAIRTGLPYVGSVGALDMVNFGARDSVPQQFNNRQLLSHNPHVTLMRTTAAENGQIGCWIGDRLNQMQGKVRFLIPEQGISSLDAAGQIFYDPDADTALFNALESTVKVTTDRQLIRVPAHINDAQFAEAVVNCFNDIAIDIQTTNSPSTTIGTHD